MPAASLKAAGSVLTSKPNRRGGPEVYRFKAAQTIAGDHTLTGSYSKKHERHGAGRYTHRSRLSTIQFRMIGLGLIGLLLAACDDNAKTIGTTIGRISVPPSQSDGHAFPALSMYGGISTFRRFRHCHDEAIR